MGRETQLFLVSNLLLSILLSNNLFLKIFVFELPSLYSLLTWLCYFSGSNMGLYGN